MISFNTTDANAVHSAFWEAHEDAQARAARGMTNSAEARASQAANLKRLRDKILATLTEKDRASYPDYLPPAVT